MMTNEELAQFNARSRQVAQTTQLNVPKMSNEELNLFNARINNHIDEGLPSEMEILGWGKNESTKGPIILGDKTLEVFDENQRITGFSEVALDFEHNTVSGSSHWRPGAQDIAAYGKPEIRKGKGLFLTNLEWTPVGKKMARNYKDLSPAIKTDDEGNVMWVHSCALTTNGCVYDLNTFSANGAEESKLKNMKTLAKEVPGYNEKGANAGLKQTGDGKFDVSKATAMDDKEALEKTKELEDHEKGEIEEDKHGATCECENCMSAEEKGMAEDDHYSKYGDVKYADPTHHKYPIDTNKHIRAAWSYINKPKNAKKEGSRLSEVKAKIKASMQKIGAEVKTESTEYKTMSVNGKGIPVPISYKNQPWYYQKSMNTQIKRFSTEDAIRKLAAELEETGTEENSAKAKIIYAYLSEVEGLLKESEHLIVPEEAIQDYIKPYSTQLENALERIESIEAEKKAEIARLEKTERQSILEQFAKEGKELTLSAESQRIVPISVLREMLKGMPVTIPTTRMFKTLGANNNNETIPTTRVEKQVALAKHFKELAKNG